jgi:diguanylate cyclase (GGDEF)-like protein
MSKYFTFLITLLFPLISWAVDLTPEERDYLQQLGTIKVCVDPDWQPFEVINEKGEYKGIGADILAVVTQRLGTSVETVNTSSWEESIEASKEGRCHMISFLNQTPERDEWLLFTNITLSDVNVFITREEHLFISDPSTLRNESIVFPKGTAMEERVRQDFPNLKIMTVESEAEAFNLVSTKKADMTMRSLIVAAYTIKKEGYFNLKIAGQLPEYKNDLRMGVIKSEPRLRDILNKGINTLTNEEKEGIINKHILITAHPVTDYSLIITIVSAFGLLIFLVLFRNYELTKHNKKLQILSETDMLTNLYNRLRIDRELDREIEKARRNKRYFSILLIDIDFFKKINDNYGHQMGDKVLVSFAKSAQSQLRTGDVIGRWGGEEFLVLCPETNAKQAILVAERIRENIKEDRFADQQRYTVSIGIATLEEDDSTITLLKKADNALYLAKGSGRDKVCYTKDLG